MSLGTRGRGGSIVAPRWAIGDDYHGPTRAPEFAVLRGDPLPADLLATLAEVRRIEAMAERNRTNYWYARNHEDEMV